MSIDLPTFDPNIEDVLAEIEKEGKGSLLLTTPRRFLAGLRGATPCLEQRHITRSKAEQHLIRTHGAELARAIRILVYLRRRVVSPMGTHDSSTTVVEIDSRARHELGSQQGSTDPGRRRLLDRLLSETKVGTTGESDTDLESIALAQSLDSNPLNPEYLALAYKDHGQYRAALQVSARSLGLGVFTERSHPQLLGVHGLALASLGQHSDAAKAFIKALEKLDRIPNRPTLGVNQAFGAIACALSSEDPALVAACDRALECVDLELIHDHFPVLTTKWTASPQGQDLRKSTLTDVMKRSRSSASSRLKDAFDAIQSSI